jgi:hippurate hydrolase
MLLGAAKLLKAHERELEGQVKLVFEPAEETLSGAKNMIENGLLTSPEVGGAFMLHVMAGVPQKVGSVIVSGSGVSAPGADYFTINVKGKGCHGSMPQQGVDAITAAAHILIALQEISARELGVDDAAVLTVGSFSGGNAGNVIADCVNMHGTLRSFDESLRSHIKKRIECIANSVAQAFRADACVTYTSGCPSLLNDQQLSDFTEVKLIDLLGDAMVLSSKALGSSIKGGSDDFAYISREVPSITIALAAGEPEKGFSHPQHHPKVMFDEECLPVGAAIYAHIAAEWLKEQSKH